MNILQICKKTPIPPKDGEAIAIHQLTEMLSKEHQVAVLAMLTSKHGMQGADEGCKVKGINYQFVNVATEISLLAMFRNLFSHQPYITERFYSKNFEQKLIELLQSQKFDIIHLEGLFPAIYLPVIKKYCQAKVVLRAHNIEFQIWERLATSEPNFLKKWYLKNIMIPRLKKLEIKVSQAVNAIVPISPIDAKFFKNIGKKKSKILTLPVGYKTFIKPQNNWENTFNVGFIGGLDWLPNIEGLLWFVKNVWKEFAAKNLHVQLNIAGRNLTKKIEQLSAPSVKIVGEVENAQEFITKQHIMLVPLFSGSGMRIKIIEAMAMGKCVLSTNIGAEGIEIEHHKDIFLCNHESEFLETLNKCHQNTDLIEKIGANAIQTIHQKYNMEDLSKKIHQFYAQL